MGNLPDPKDFTPGQFQPIGGIASADTRTDFDLNDYAEKLIQARKQLDPSARDELAFELFPWSFYCYADPCFYWKTPRYAVGYSKKHKSLTLSLYQDKEVKAIVIRRATTEAGETVKWKTYGSKSFTPHRIRPEDEVLFIASGMAEVLAFEILGSSYICFQSDAITTLSDEVKAAAAGKLAVILPDYDEAGDRWARTVSTLFDAPVTLTMPELTGRDDLPRGYDLRDLINDNSAKSGPYYARAAGETILDTLFRMAT